MTNMSLVAAVAKLPSISNSTTRERRLMSLSESVADAGAQWMTSGEVDFARKQLPEALLCARSRLEPGDAEEVLMALEAFAVKRNVPLPVGLALEMDVEVMASWPRDLFREAFRQLWENFPAHYRRMPEVSEFKGFIADSLARRKRDLALLIDLQLAVDRRAGVAAPYPGGHGCAGLGRAGRGCRQIGDAVVPGLGSRPSAS